MWRPTLWRAECGAGAVFEAFRNAFSSPWGSALHRIRAGFHRVSKRGQVGGGVSPAKKPGRFSRRFETRRDGWRTAVVCETGARHATHPQRAAGVSRGRGGVWTDPHFTITHEHFEPDGCKSDRRVHTWQVDANLAQGCKRCKVWVSPCTLAPFAPFPLLVTDSACHRPGGP